MVHVDCKVQLRCTLFERVRAVRAVRVRRTCGTCLALCYAQKREVVRAYHYVTRGQSLTSGTVYVRLCEMACACGGT